TNYRAKRWALLPHQFQPSRCVKTPQLIYIAQSLIFWHIVYHDLKYPVKHTAGNDMAHLLIQLRDVFSKAAEDFHIFHRVFYFNLNHVVDKMLVACAFRPTEQQLYWFSVLADVIHHPVDTV